VIYALLILIALATRSVGDLRAEQYAIAEAIVFGVLWMRQESWFPGPAVLNRLLVFVSAVAATGLYLHVDIGIKLAMLFFLVLLLRRGEDERRRAAADWALPAVAVFAVAYTVLFNWPLTYNFVREFSFWYSDLFAALSPPQLPLGPTSAGWAVILAGTVFIITLQFRSPKARWGNTLAAVALLLIGQLVFWAAAPYLAVKVARYIPITRAVYIHLAAFYLVWVMLVVRVLAWIHPPQAPAAPPLLYVRRRNAIIWGAIGIAAILCAGPFGANGGAGQRVWILNADKLDSITPDYRRFGDRSGGMFGMLPKFCRALGYDVRLANPTPEIFDSVDVIIFANLLDSLPRWQHDSLLSFVRRGGGLLALADHTGYDAIRGPTNDITEPMGLSLNFDTAVPLRRSWVGQMRFLPQRLTQSIREHSDVEVWLGASVSPFLGSMPAVIGTFAYSDPGDPNNKERSYLGNLAYDNGEPLADVVIAATAYYGLGRVALFGDTSPFQNGALVKSHRLAARTLAWLGGGSSLWDRVRSWAFPVLLIAAAAAVFWLAGIKVTGLAYLVLLPVFSISVWNLYPAGEPDEWRSSEMNLAYIDATHGQIYDLMGWEKYSIGGIELNLMRNGYAPQVRKDWRPDWLDKARLLLILRPSQIITRKEIGQLMTYIENGGWVLVAAGWEEHEAVDDLLGEFGIKIENIPLGRAEGRGLGEKPVFARAYALTTNDPKARVLCTGAGLPLVTAVRRGKGGLVAIGDPVFLFNDNLENRDEDYHLENIKYFHELMLATAGSWGKVEEVKP
jgi:hypothetical protein